MNMIPKISHIKIVLKCSKSTTADLGWVFQSSVMDWNPAAPPPSRFAAACSLWCCAPHPPTDDIIRCGLRWGAFKTANRRRTSQRCWAGKKRACALCSFIPTSLHQQLHGCSVCEHHRRQARDNSRRTWGASCRLLSAAPDRLTPARIASTVTAKCSFEQTKLHLNSSIVAQPEQQAFLNVWTSYGC